MTFIRTAGRNEVLEAYFARERAKGRRLPDPPFPDHPDAIDALLGRLVLKPGVIGGYLVWHYVALDVADLGDCAIVEAMAAREFPTARTQRLGDIARCAAFRGWRPDRPTTWEQELALSPDPCTYPDSLALILRPALPHECGARWYIEDGSGRAVFWLRRVLAAGGGGAWAYLGRTADRRSSFMRCFEGGALLRDAPPDAADAAR